MAVVFDKESAKSIAKAVVRVLKTGGESGQGAARSFADTLILAQLKADLSAYATTPVDAEVLDTQGGSVTAVGSIVKVVDHLGWDIANGKRVVLAPSHRDDQGNAIYFPIAAEC